MNSPCTPDLHERIARDLPWLVNGTLPESAAAEIRRHLECCTTCSRDYQAQMRLYEAMQAEDSLVFAPEASFQRLLSRLEASEAAAHTSEAEAGPATSASARVGTSDSRETRLRGSRRARDAGADSFARSRRAAVVRWHAAAGNLEALGLGAALWLLPRHEGGVSAPYMTLTSPEPRYGTGERVRVVFRAGLTLDELGGLLRRMQARIVEGPTGANVYTLGFSDSRVAGAPMSLDVRIAKLRASGDVLFAEPANSGSPR